MAFNDELSPLAWKSQLNGVPHSENCSDDWTSTCMDRYHSRWLAQEISASELSSEPR
jgi:hypothetical protein